MGTNRWWPGLDVFGQVLADAEPPADRLQRLLTEPRIFDEDAPPVLPGSDAFGDRPNGSLVTDKVA